MSTGHSTPHPAKPRIAKTMGKARIFSEAMPFIKAYRGQTVVIKYGGAAMTSRRLQEQFAEDVVLLRLIGMKPVVVHGGGPEISRQMKRSEVSSWSRTGWPASPRSRPGSLADWTSR